MSRARLIVLVVLLAGVSAFAPLSMDMYLPSFPTVLADLHTTASAVQWTLTADVLGIVLGQLVIGPLSDAHGRRRLLIGSTVIAAVAALLCAFAPSVGWLIFWRFWQGFGGGGGMAIARALATDVAKGNAAARLYSLFLSLSFIAPLVAPLIGGILLTWTGDWRASFIALAISSAVLAAAIWWLIPETLAVADRHAGGLRKIGQTFVTLLRNRVFVGFMLIVVFAYASLFAYISGSSFALQDVYGVSPLAYSVIFAVNAAGMIALGFANARLVKRHSVMGLLSAGLWLGAVAAVVLVVLVAVDQVPLGVVLIPLFLVVASRGFSSGNAMVLGVEQSKATGSASAILGAAMFAGGILIAPFLGSAPKNAAVSMSLIIAVTSILAVAATVLVRGATRNR